MQRHRIEMAAARILEDAVHDSIEAVAGGNRSSGDTVEFACGKRPARLLLHRDLRPEFGRDETVPVNRRRAARMPS